MEELRVTISQQDVTQLQNTPLNESRKHIFSSAHGIYQDRPYSGPNNKSQIFKRIDIISIVFSDHSGVKLEISNREMTEKSPNTSKLNNTLLNNP